jgi:hypothetical protein
LVIASVPEVVIGLPLIANSTGTVAATLVTVPEPTPPGKSAVTSARNVGCAALPVVGPAHTVFAVSFTFEIANVPVLVTGEPITWNSTGTVCATLVTVPPPGVTEVVENVPIFWIEQTV